MLDILLLNSPLKALTQKDKEVKEQYLPPLGLGYITTYLEENKLSVELIDCIYEQLSLDEINEMIINKKPRYVGINIFTPNLHIVQEIIRRAPSDVIFIIGAQLVKSIYNDIASWKLGHKLIVVCGEGELIIPEIVKGTIQEKPILENKTTKVYWVGKESQYYPKDLSTIKLNRSLFSDRIIVNKYNLKEDCMVASRGCIYNCAFCGGAAKLNKDVCSRQRNKESIIDEIENIKKVNPDVQSIRMLDDLFLRNRLSIQTAIEIFKEEALRWRAMAHVYSFKNNDDLLIPMAQSGCLELFIGIESGSDRMRKKINKLGSSEEVYQCIKNILAANINVKGYFMYGLPEEEKEDMEETYLLAKKLHETAKGFKVNFRTSTFQFRPYHGTQLYDELKKKGAQIDEFTENNKLNIIKGRKQFNFTAGNFSNCTQDIVDDYIIRTLKMNEE